MDALLSVLDKLDAEFKTVRNTAEKFAAVTASVSRSAAAAGNSAERAAPKVKKFTAQFEKFVSDKFSGFKHNVSKMIDGVGAALSRTTPKMGKFFSSIVRIAKYRLIRTALRNIIKAIKEGTENFYNFSKAVGAPFAAAMDSVKASAGKMKNQLGAAFGTLFTTIAPIIEQLIGLITRLANVLTMVFAAFTGGGGWYRAKSGFEAVGKAAGDAGNEAKKAMRYLAPFDELNRLPSESNGGGGGGGSDIGLGDYEFVPFDDFGVGLTEFADKVREYISNAEWGHLGTLIGDKFNEIFNNINWAELGTSLGKFINALFTTKYWTLEAINFTNIGEKIATFLNNALSEINFEKIGAGFMQIFTNLGDLIIGVVENINWTEVGESIGSFVRGAFDQAGNWLKSLNFYDLGYGLVTKLNNLFSGIDFSSTVESVKNAIHNAFVAAGNFLAGVLDGLDDNFGLDIDVGIKNIDITDQSGTTETAWQGKLYAALKVAAGAAIGLVLGGKKGALFGAFLALALQFAITNNDVTDESGWGQTEWVNAIDSALVPVGAFLTGWKLVPGKNPLWKFSVGLGLAFGLDYIEDTIKNNAGEVTGEDWAKAIIAAILPTAGVWVGMIIAPAVGIPGALLAITVGIALSYLITHYDPPEPSSEFELGTDFWLKILGVPEPPKLNIPVDFDTMDIEAKFNAIKTQLERLGYEDVLYKVPVSIDFEAEYPDLAGYFEEFGNDGNYKYYVPIGLIPDEWTTPTEWVDSFVDENDVVEQPVGLVENNWSASGGGAYSSDFYGHFRTNTVSYWVASHGGKELLQPVSLGKENWSDNVSDWVYQYSGGVVNKPVGLVKGNWTYISEWLKEPARSGGVVNKPIGVIKNGWANLAEWAKKYPGGAVNKPVGVAKNGWTNLAEWIKQSAQYGGIVSKTISLTANLLAALVVAFINNTWNKLGDKTITLTVAMNNQMGKDISNIKGAWNTLVGAWNRTPILANKASLWYLASGGIVNKTGQMFVARESGPELVGSYGSKTAVMNNDQIVRSVADGVARSIASIRFSLPSSYAFGGGLDEETIYRAMIRALTEVNPGDVDVNVTMDGEPIYRDVVRRNRANTRMTGVNALA